MNETYLPSPKPGENIWLWLMKIISGVLIVVLLFIHFLVNHYLAPEGLLSYGEVVAYFQNPIVLLMEGTFLVLVVIHSLLGLRSILLDLNPSPSRLRLLDWALTILGLAAVSYGIWLLLSVAAQGQA